jgi:putative hydrolase of the HAD superfamily
MYPRGTGIMEQLRTLILRYIQTRFDLPTEEAEELRRRYFQIYGTTMRGLQVNHQIDADEFLAYVHDMPLHEYLQPNPQLDAVLASIPQRKVIFTNASREHAEGVLAQLGVRRHFEQIVDVRDMSYESKPKPDAYQRICDILSVQPQECMLVEDNIRNLRPAKALGMATVLVNSNGTDACVDYAIDRIEDIGNVLEQIV